MHGTGIPIVTPFDETGRVDHETLAELVTWLESAGGDFLAPCGSSGEAPSLTTDERVAVIETVVDAADGPVVAGTGHEGYEPTLEETTRAAEVGAEAALVVTPSYYGFDDDALAAYYRDLADVSPLPIVLYSVPKFTGHALSPETVAELAAHENVVGIKDSSGSLESLQRIARKTTDESFDVLVGAGSVYATGLEAGATGGILAMGNVVPDGASEVFRSHRDGALETAFERNGDLVELNRAVTARYGVPGIKAALSSRWRDVGDPRRPLRPVGSDAREELDQLLADVLEEPDEVKTTGEE